MKTAIFVAFVAGLVNISCYKPETIVYEQIAFDYFVSDILPTEFAGLSSIEFKGKTENTFSTFGEYKFCLKPEEKLQSLVGEVATGDRKNRQKISYDQVKNVSIVEFKDASVNPKVFVYPSVRVADNYYVFMSLQKPNEEAARFVFELRPEGNISRTCRME